MHSYVCYTQKPRRSEHTETEMYTSRTLPDSSFTVLIFCWRHEGWGKWKCHFFVFPLTEKYKVRVKSIPDSSNSQKGFFSDADIVNVVLCCCEETVLALSVVGTTAQASADSGQNSFSGEPQPLRIVSKGIKCTTILCIKPLPRKPAILIISSSQPWLQTFTAASFLQFIFYPTNNTSFPLLLMTPTQICSLLSNYWGPDVRSVW